MPGKKKKKKSFVTHPERHLQVLSTPDVHPWIVASYFFKVCFVDGEETSRHGGRPEGKIQHAIYFLCARKFHNTLQKC